MSSMTKQEAIEILTEMRDWNDYITQSDALQMAIDALEKEPAANSEDAISRQAVMDGLEKYHNTDMNIDGLTYAYDLVCKLPSVSTGKHCEDAISRTEAIRVASGYCHWTNIPKELEKLPSVNPIPCEDAISRQAVKEIINDIRDCISVEGYCAILERMKKLPSVSTEKLDKAKSEIRCGENKAYNADFTMGCEYALSVIERMLEEQVSTEKTGRCKDCKYFEYDSFEKINGMQLIVAHEICSKWADGCKTREDGYCFLFEPKTQEVEK